MVDLQQNVCNYLKLRKNSFLKQNTLLRQGHRKQMDIGGAGNSGNLGGSGRRHPQIILKYRTPEIRFPAFWEVIFSRKAHYKLEVWERVDQD